MSTLAAVIGRILLGALFLLSGLAKLMDVGATERMLASGGMPVSFAIPVAVFEIAAGAFLALGVMTRLTAIALAVFTALATVLYHAQVTDPAQAVQALKNLAVIGGLLLVFAHSQMWWSYDRMRRARRGEHAELDAERRVHEAELRAARAEGALHGVEATTHATTHPVRPRRRWF